MTDWLSVAVEACGSRGAMQRTDELAAALDAVAEVGPRVIVEVGCGNGGSLFCWAQFAADVYGITAPVPNPAAIARHGAELLIADSHLPSSLGWLRERLAGRPVDVLHIDGDHTHDGVRADWEMYAPLVRSGGLALLHDIANTRDPDMGVPQFWAELRERYATEEIVSPLRPLGIGLVRRTNEWPFC